MDSQNGFIQFMRQPKTVLFAVFYITSFGYLTIWYIRFNENHSTTGNYSKSEYHHNLASISGSHSIDDQHDLINTNANLSRITSETALRIYEEKLKQMVGKFVDVRTLNTSFVSYDLSMINQSKEVDGNPKWEPETFREFTYWLPKSKYYVGFGTWIGVTLFYATQLVEKAIGFEGDPSAYAGLYSNLHGNSHRTWYNHTYIYPVAVRAGDDENGKKQVTMRSDKAGNSCSGMEEIRRRKDNACGNDMNKMSWDIDAYTLPHLLKFNNIPVTKETFIKIDVESYECELIPSWFDWLKDSFDKPTMIISFHGPSVRCCSIDQYNKILALSRIYKDLWLVTSEGRTKVEPEDYFNMANCSHCTCPNKVIVFSDLEQDM